MENEMRICKKCGVELPLTRFSLKGGGRAYRRGSCIKCEYEASRHRNPTALRAREKRARDKARANPVRSVLKDCRNSDAKRNFPNDLDFEFVLNAINQPCLYCGDSLAAGVKMTLDRIDNHVGHLKSNVVPACYRCNLTRRDMPFEAWMMLVDGMRKAREAGLFGDWMKIPFRKRETPVEKMVQEVGVEPTTPH